jgi:Ca-activated chloride channel family protein
MRRQARAYIDALEANGGTMMAGAVEAVCRTPAAENRLRVVTFMTDGYVGNDLEVLGLVKKLRGTSRWFSFGTGDSVNRFLIDGMARLGGGEADYVRLDASGEDVARTFHDKIASPVLTDVQVAFEGLDVIDVLPRERADVWAERPLVVHARYRTPGRGRAILRGFQQGKPHEQALAVILPDHAPGHDAIASMWARAKVEALTQEDLAAMQSGSFPPALRDEVVRVALGHRLLTPFTSFVAVEDRVVNEGGVARTVAVPVEMPRGVTYEGVFGDAASARMHEAVAPSAPAAAGLVAKSMARGSGPRPRAQAQPPVEARDERDVSARRLDATVRGRLAPELLALLEAAPGGRPARDWVRIEVTLARGDAALVRALEAAGLQISQVRDRFVIGLAALDAIAAMARLPEVVRVALAT